MQDKGRYGSTKIELDKVVDVLEDKKEKSYFDLMEEEKKEKINENIKEISTKLDIVLKKLDGVISRLDALLIGEKPEHAKLEPDIKKVALELELLSIGEKISIEKLAERVGMSKERVNEAVKKLIEKGFKYQIIEEERKVGFISKKKTYIVKL
ncbi:MAG: hypothetical protein DRN25_04710 [Thermoplasmata archaeon]|nr:MAG: hypothetical protein DRN25_04710 [Thermoplasmata archaeon]